jgi:serine/threonine protein kinase
MPHDLDHLLLQWEERLSDGEKVAAEDLCLDSPDSVPELQERMTAVMKCNEILALESTAELGMLDTHDDLVLPHIPLPDHTIRRQLGKGGMGFVYEAWDANLHRSVALKMIRANTALTPQANQQMMNRFQREAKVLAKLKHPHIVPIYSAHFQEGEACFAMEYIEGGTLAQHGERFIQRGPTLIVPFMRKVADAVHYAHEHGILHRDLKPGNILLDGEEPRVSDFGLAKYLDDSTDFEISSKILPTAQIDTIPSVADTNQLTKEGFQPGTPGYMAPEVLNLPTRVTPATDIWGLGAILYELFTGNRFIDAKQDLFQLTDPNAIAKKFKLLRQKVSPRLAHIVEKCLAENPLERYQSAQEVSQALERWERRPGYVKYALAASVILFASLITLALKRQPGAYDQFCLETAPLLKQLEETGELPLVGANRTEEIKYFVHHELGKPIISPASQNLFVSSDSELMLVELLPRLPDQNKSYRITARLVMDKVNSFAFGVFVNHSKVTTGRTSHYYFQPVRIAPMLLRAEPNVKSSAPIAWKYQTCLEPNLFSPTMPFEHLPYRLHIHSTQHQIMQAGKMKLSDPLVTMREYPYDETVPFSMDVEVIVRPTELLVSTRDASDFRQTFTPLLQSTCAERIAENLENLGDLHEVKPSAFRGSSLGVFSAKFARFKVESFAISTLLE